jgi:hypothetical protein
LPLVRLIALSQPRRPPDVLLSKYQQLTTPDEAARWFAVDPENPQGAV